MSISFFQTLVSVFAGTRLRKLPMWHWQYILNNIRGIITTIVHFLNVTDVIRVKWNEYRFCHVLFYRAIIIWFPHS